MNNISAAVTDDLAAVVQVMDSLGRNRGGLTRAVLARFRLLAQGRRAILVTVSHQHDIQALFAELQAEGELPAHAELLNFHTDLRTIPRPLVPKANFHHLTWEDGGQVRCASEPVSSGSLRRYFERGVMVGTVVRNDNGQLVYVDRHNPENPWRRDSRDVCWPDGSIVKRDYFDDVGVARFRNYLDNLGRPYLSVWVNENNYEYRAIEHKNVETVHHGDMRAANAAWLAEKLQSIGPSVVFADEPRTSFSFSIASPDVFHVASIHTTHYKNNRDKSEGLKQWMDPYLKSIQNVGQFVFFTDSQRQDFVADTGCDPLRTGVVPHPAPVEEGLALRLQTERANQLFVTVSRLGTDKQIHQAIEAFAMVHGQFPEAKYEIYGEGPEKHGLQEQIMKLDLLNTVSLEGHASQPLVHFAEAACSIFTSKYEGFGLVLTESFSCGTPVIAYDVIYGPHDIIDTGKNGILVESGNVKALADSLISFLKDSETQERLQNGASLSAKIYSQENWANGWKAQLSTATQLVSPDHH